MERGGEGGSDGTGVNVEIDPIAAPNLTDLQNSNEIPSDLRNLRRQTGLDAKRLG